MTWKRLVECIIHNPQQPEFLCRYEFLGFFLFTFIKSNCQSTRSLPWRPLLAAVNVCSIDSHLTGALVMFYSEVWNWDGVVPCKNAEYSIKPNPAVFSLLHPCLISTCAAQMQMWHFQSQTSTASPTGHPT